MSIVNDLAWYLILEILFFSILTDLEFLVLSG